MEPRIRRDGVLLHARLPRPDNRLPERQGRVFHPNHVEGSEWRRGRNYGRNRIGVARHLRPRQDILRRHGPQHHFRRHILRHFRQLRRQVHFRKGHIVRQVRCIRQPHSRHRTGRGGHGLRVGRGTELPLRGVRQRRDRRGVDNGAIPDNAELQRPARVGGVQFLHHVLHKHGRGKRHTVNIPHGPLSRLDGQRRRGQPLLPHRRERVVTLLLPRDILRTALLLLRRGTRRNAHDNPIYGTLQRSIRKLLRDDRLVSRAVHPHGDPPGGVLPLRGVRGRSGRELTIRVPQPEGAHGGVRRHSARGRFTELHDRLHGEERLGGVDVQEILLQRHTDHKRGFQPHRQRQGIPRRRLRRLVHI